VLIVAMGLITVVAGGLTGKPGVVVLGVVIGAVLLFAVVWRARRQTWRRRADELADRITEHGV
jgi:Flp pilus assembly protein TadB